MSRLRRAARYASAVFLAAGLLALGYAGFVVIDARVYQRNAARRFEQARQDAVAKAALTLAPAAPVPVARVPDDGESMGQIVIPRLGLTVMIAQGDSTEILERAVGHLPGTALPGVTGNVVLAGHRDTFFRPLKDVRVGDTITIRTLEGEFDYRVESTSVVRPTDVQVLEPTGGRTLTLITCFPFYYVGAAPNRFIVRARAS
jgi:sortase A